MQTKITNSMVLPGVSKRFKVYISIMLANVSNRMVSSCLALCNIYLLILFYTNAFVNSITYIMPLNKVAVLELLELKELQCMPNKDEFFFSSEQ